jgi:hypothetical protein
VYASTGLCNAKMFSLYCDYNLQVVCSTNEVCKYIVIQLCQDVQFRVILNIFIKVHATITGLVTDPVSSLATNGRHVSGSCLDQVCVSFFIFSSKIVISTRYFIKLVFHFTV